MLCICLDFCASNCSEIRPPPDAHQKFFACRSTHLHTCEELQKVQMWGCALFHFPKLFLVARHFSNHGEQRARAQESTHPHRLQGWRSGDSFKWSACPERPTSSPCFLESWTDPQLRFWSRLSTQKFWNHCDWLTCLWLAGGWGLTRAERLDYGDGEQKVLAAIRSIWHFIRNPPL